MNNLSRKLSELENNVVNDDVKEDTCKIDVSEVPDAEKELHKLASQLTSQSFDSLTPDSRAIIEHSCELLTLRTFLLFRKMVKHLNFLQDSAMSGYFDIRLMWFLSESVKLGMQQSDMKELELANAGLSEDDLEQKRCELEATFEKLYTPESWDKYELEAWRKLFALHEKREQEVKA